MAAAMKVVVLGDVMPCGSCRNLSFGGKYSLHRQGEKNQRSRKTASSNQHPTYAAKKYHYFFAAYVGC
jgi:hypothetical protein